MVHEVADRLRPLTRLSARHRRQTTVTTGRWSDRSCNSNIRRPIVTHNKIISS